MHGDNSDLYLETIREENGKFEYFYEGKWYPVKIRKEVFNVKGNIDFLNVGKQPIERDLMITIHGPVISQIMSNANKPKTFYKHNYTAISF